ncbi:hypothetical protein T265_05662 [Opisthorchis viverrini]|uniref:Uncharacterized protein n=1 Tax=Opisthorchis viverrini TaxID=6198 RepID=A0A074ZIV4_OPIVI|nr:hypothetical protein T265_05662 [Opisthorchis viverrini]KER27258.1 hypothetical protein T265_05662 [Opisthorchis viverrini]
MPAEQLQTSGQGSKSLICILLTKLNIHLLLERVFLNFPGYSLTINDTERLHKFRKRSHFSIDEKRVCEKKYYSHTSPLREDHYEQEIPVGSRLASLGGRKKAFAAELFIRKCQVNSYGLLNREAKLSYASCLQKLNIRLLFERVFLDFPGNSFTQMQISLYKRREADLRENALLACPISSIHRYTGSSGDASHKIKASSKFVQVVFDGMCPVTTKSQQSSASLHGQLRNTCSSYTAEKIRPASGTSLRNPQTISHFLDYSI